MLLVEYLPLVIGCGSETSQEETKERGQDFAQSSRRVGNHDFPHVKRRLTHLKRRVTTAHVKTWRTDQIKIGRRSVISYVTIDKRGDRLKLIYKVSIQSFSPPRTKTMLLIHSSEQQVSCQISRMPCQVNVLSVILPARTLFFLSAPSALTMQLMDSSDPNVSSSSMASVVIFPVTPEMR